MIMQDLPKRALPSSVCGFFFSSSLLVVVAGMSFFLLRSFVRESIQKLQLRDPNHENKKKKKEEKTAHDFKRVKNAMHL